MFTSSARGWYTQSSEALNTHPALALTEPDHLRQAEQEVVNDPTPSLNREQGFIPEPAWVSSRGLGMYSGCQPM